MFRDDAAIDEMVRYVQNMADGMDTTSPAHTQYMTLCIACHGPDGKGLQALGAPSLVDDIWLYGSSADEIRKSIVEGRNGVICSLVSPEGERSMAADRGAAASLRADEIDSAWLDGCDHLFVSGYSLMREPARGAALRMADLAHERGVAISVDLASWSAIRDSGPDPFRQAVVELRPQRFGTFRY